MNVADFAFKIYLNSDNSTDEISARNFTMTEHKL